MAHNPAIDWSLAARRDVEQFMHDEFHESLPSTPDRDALIGADRAAYVLHQTISYEYARPVRDLRQRLMVMPRDRHADQRVWSNASTFGRTATSGSGGGKIGSVTPSSTSACRPSTMDRIPHEGNPGP